MLRPLWKMLGRSSLCGTAMLVVAGLAHGQTTTPSVLPSSPIQLVSAAAAPSGMETPRDPQAPIIPSVPNVLPAPAAPAVSSTPDDLKARIERLEKQNQDLLNALKSIQAQPQNRTAPTSAESGNEETGGSNLSKDEVQKMVKEYLGQREEDAKKAADAKKKDQEEKGYTVGKSLGLTGVWTTGKGAGGYQPWFETEDKAFRVHFGGRIQPDFIFGAGADHAVINGKGGTGPFLEGSNFRRARLEADGWIYENADFFIEFDWANTAFNTGQPALLARDAAGKVTNVAASGATPTNLFNVPAPTDVWAGINYMPCIGSFRVGNLKPPIGLDHLTSSRFLDFMERSIGFDTYYNRNNGFEPGFMIFNWSDDLRMTYQIAATRATNSPFAWTLGGGAWDYTGRLTWLPYYEAEGRCMVHLGIGGKYQRMDLDTFNFNDRWLLRNVQSGLQNVVSQVVLTGVDQEMINPELFINMGPLSIQAEYIGSRVTGVTRFATQLNASVATPSKNFTSQTAYVQAMYFLTGESRPYGTNALHGSGAAPTRVVPFRNFFWVHGDGTTSNPLSCGAWQVGARYCYSDLNDNGINGGEINEVTLGLNWFLNPNMKFQWNYDIGHRSIKGGTSDGYYQGFGMRMALDF